MVPEASRTFELPLDASGWCGSFLGVSTNHVMAITVGGSLHPARTWNLGMARIFNHTTSAVRLNLIGC